MELRKHAAPMELNLTTLPAEASATFYFVMYYKQVTPLA